MTVMLRANGVDRYEISSPQRHRDHRADGIWRMECVRNGREIGVTFLVRADGVDRVKFCVYVAGDDSKEASDSVR